MLYPVLSLASLVSTNINLEPCVPGNRDKIAPPGTLASEVAERNGVEWSSVSWRV